jgi:hypothetical protein
MMEGMWFKRYIQIKIYKFYLKGLTIEQICLHLDMDEKDVNEIIDYINELYH